MLMHNLHLVFQFSLPLLGLLEATLKAISQFSIMTDLDNQHQRGGRTGVYQDCSVWQLINNLV